MFVYFGGSKWQLTRVLSPQSSTSELETSFSSLSDNSLCEEEELAFESQVRDKQVNFCRPYRFSHEGLAAPDYLYVLGFPCCSCMTFSHSTHGLASFIYTSL